MIASKAKGRRGLKGVSRGLKGLKRPERLSWRTDRVGSLGLDKIMEKLSCETGEATRSELYCRGGRPREGQDWAQENRWVGGLAPGS